jgi:hypothetical protein
LKHPDYTPLPVPFSLVGVLTSAYFCCPQWRPPISGGHSLDRESIVFFHVVFPFLGFVPCFREVQNLGDRAKPIQWSLDRGVSPLRRARALPLAMRDADALSLAAHWTRVDGAYRTRYRTHESVLLVQKKVKPKSRRAVNSLDRTVNCQVRNCPAPIEEATNATCRTSCRFSKLIREGEHDISKEASGICRPLRRTKNFTPQSNSLNSFRPLAPPALRLCG